MRRLKGILSAALAAAMLLGMSSAALAADDPSEKEEVVYAVLDASGGVTGVYVVNVFDGGKITDYGDYSSVRNLNTTDELRVSGDKITASTAGKLYYEGTLESRDIPWNISVRYFMDGREYTPEDVAGKSGRLEMRIAISENFNCSGTFFEHYALQAAVTLNTKTCTDIVADGATLANVGSDKQLSYIIFPGKETELTIFANVTDFEMDPIQINGLPLNLAGNLDINADSLGLSEYEGLFSDLRQGAADLDDGANEVKDGAADIAGGASELADGARSLSGGLNDLKGNNSAILAGAQQMADAVFASATAELQAQLVEAGMSEEEAAHYVLTPSTYIAVIAALSGGAPTESQIALAENTIRSQLSAAGILDAGQQSLAMTIAAQKLAAGEASSVDAALSLAGSLMADAAFVQTAAATYSADPAVAALVGVLMAAPYSMDASTAGMVACTAVALNPADPSSQIAAAIAKVQNAGVISAASANADSIRALCIAVVQEQMAASADEFATLKAQLDGVAAYLDGLKTYTSGVASAASAASSVASGASDLSEGASSLLEGAEALADGTGELRTQTDDFGTDLSGTIQDKIDEALSEFGTDDFTPVSFVSDKNTNVRSVQFVIKTGAVKVAEAQAVQEEETKPLTFWQKLLRLFGLY